MEPIQEQTERVEAEIRYLAIRYLAFHGHEELGGALESLLASWREQGEQLEQIRKTLRHPESDEHYALLLRINQSWRDEAARKLWNEYRTCQRLRRQLEEAQAENARLIQAHRVELQERDREIARLVVEDESAMAERNFAIDAEEKALAQLAEAQAENDGLKLQRANLNAEVENLKAQLHERIGDQWIGEVEARVRMMSAESQLAERPHYCLYCGHESPSGTSGEDLAAHIRECPKHPLPKALAQLAERDKELERLRGIIDSMHGSMDNVKEELLASGPEGMVGPPFYGVMKIVEERNRLREELRLQETATVNLDDQARRIREEQEGGEK